MMRMKALVLLPIWWSNQLKSNFLAQQVFCGQEGQAPLLLRSPDLPGDGHHQGEDGAEPDLLLDQGTVRIL